MDSQLSFYFISPSTAKIYLFINIFVIGDSNSKPNTCTGLYWISRRTQCVFPAGNSQVLAAENVRIEKKSQELAAETLELKEISGTGTVLATEMLELKLISGIGH